MQAQIFVEYVMLNRVNDAPETAHELGQLLRGKNMILNLIPWNPIYSPDMHFEAPGGARVTAFQRIVREEYGVFCTVRQEMGQDISGNPPCLSVSYGPLLLVTTNHMTLRWGILLQDLESRDASDVCSPLHLAMSAQEVKMPTCSLKYQGVAITEIGSFMVSSSRLVGCLFTCER